MFPLQSIISRVCIDHGGRRGGGSQREVSGEKSLLPGLGALLDEVTQSIAVLMATSD